MFLAISLSLTFTLPKSTRGSVLIGNSDVVLLSTFDSSQSEVRAATDDLVPVNFYHSLCSEVGPFQHMRNNSTQLITTINSPREIDELYLMKGSQVNYSFSVSDSFAVSDSNTSDLCIANIFVFFHQLHYLEFIRSGHVSKFSLAARCLNPTEPLDFSLRLPTDYQSRYYFVGLASHYDSTLNYTINSNLLEYSIANLSKITCNFSTTADKCSIPLSHYPSDQEICVLASIQADTFVTINYFAVSHGYRRFFIATFTMYGFTALFLLLTIFSCFL